MLRLVKVRSVGGLPADRVAWRNDAAIGGQDQLVDDRDRMRVS